MVLFSAAKEIVDSSTEDTTDKYENERDFSVVFNSTCKS